MSTTTKRKTSTPPDGYLCKQCGVAGHWIQQCPDKKKKKRKRNHLPVAGVDPSADDIREAQAMQKIPPPNCHCGVKARLKKVKRSHVNGESSRAIGKYFFFCGKAQKDPTKCRFARRVAQDAKSSRGVCKSFQKDGTCPFGDKCMFSHDVVKEEEIGGRRENTKIVFSEVEKQEKEEEENEISIKKEEDEEDDENLIKEEEKDEKAHAIKVKKEEESDTSSSDSSSSSDSDSDSDDQSMDSYDDQQF